MSAFTIIIYNYTAGRPKNLRMYMCSKKHSHFHVYNNSVKKLTDFSKFWYVKSRENLT